MTQFILAYEVNDKTYTCKVDAPTWDAAERHLRALAATGRVSGEWVCDVNEPVLYIHPATFASEYAHVGAWKPGHECDGYIPLYIAPHDDEVLMSQALEALEAVSDYQADMGQHRAAIAALRERLGETK